MKKIVLLSILLLGAVSACAQKAKKHEKTSCAGWMEVDSTICAQLGEKLTKLLFNPNTVKVYSLERQDAASDSTVQIEPGFYRGRLVKKLSRREIAVLQYGLLSFKENYSEDSIKVMSPYVPCIEFEFVKRRQKASVVISLSDFSWRIIYEGKPMKRHNYCNSEFIERFCSYYLSKTNK